MADSRRGGALTILAILFAILAVSDILKPFHLEGATTGLVFFGKRLSGTPDAILAPILGIILLSYAAGIWRMRRYAMYLGYAYAIYVTANLVLFSVRNPPPASHGEAIFGLFYIIFALAFSWGTADTSQPPQSRSYVTSFRYRFLRRLRGRRLAPAIEPSTMTNTPTDANAAHHRSHVPAKRVNPVSRKAAPITHAHTRMKAA